MIKIRHKGIEVEVDAAEGDSLLHALVTAGVYLAAPCGGKGKCGKCRVRLISGEVAGEKTDSKGTIRACIAKIKGDAVIETLEGNTEEIVKDSGVNFSSQDAKKEVLTNLQADEFGVALDVGTTTVVASLVNLTSGQILETFSALNAQGIFGADVISRITAATAGKTEMLNRLIINQTGKIIAGFKARHKVGVISKLAVSANTTMLHLFANVNPQSIGVLPFKPVFSEPKEFEGQSVGLDVKTVYLMPSIAGFLGGDIVAGIVQMRVFDEKETTLLIDIGTNGEMALNHGGKLYCCSTATGPALEGAEISCGKGGTAGAIDHVFYNDGKVSFTTIGAVPPDGICGSGLIDAISVMIKKGEMDESGALEGEAFVLSDKVSISQRDVRQFQLAKSALKSGIILLAKAAGTSATEIKKVYITGGLGFYLNTTSAIMVGMLPREFTGKIQVCPNLSLRGAVSYLQDGQFKADCASVARSCTNIELASSSEFMDEFSMNMMFED